MAELPLLYTTEMVRAILADRKTQTRRVPVERYRNWKAGDLIWVREAILLKQEKDTPYFDALYYADNNHMENLHELDDWFMNYNLWYYRCKDKQIIPSIHMPKQAARIWLEITGLREEAVQEISNEDSFAEGCIAYDDREYWKEDPMGAIVLADTPRDEFQTLWNQINSKRQGGIYAWSQNPKVKVIEFKRINK